MLVTKNVGLDLSQWLGRTEGNTDLDVCVGGRGQRAGRRWTLTETKLLVVEMLIFTLIIFLKAQFLVHPCLPKSTQGHIQTRF